MAKHDINMIIVESRFRKDLGDIDALKASMTALGQLQPIGVDEGRRLVFGGRRLEAARQLGWTTIDARVVDCDALIAEHDENEMRKAFTVSERVAIAEAVAERLKGRHGSNQFKAQGGGNISTSLDDAGKTRDLAAAKAGLGSGKTLEAAQTVIAKGVPDLVQAMDDGRVTIHAAKLIATMPPEEQASVDYADPAQTKKAAEKARARINYNAQKPQPKEPARPGVKPVPDEARLYEPDSSLSALVLSHRAKTAIAQISKNDPNALPCIESIRTALARQLHLITLKDAQ